jgi:hypothetical protein
VKNACSSDVTKEFLWEVLYKKIGCGWKLINMEHPQSSIFSNHMFPILTTSGIPHFWEKTHDQSLSYDCYWKSSPGFQLASVWKSEASKSLACSKTNITMEIDGNSPFIDN